MFLTAFEAKTLLHALCFPQPSWLRQCFCHAAIRYCYLGLSECTLAQCDTGVMRASHPNRSHPAMHPATRPALDGNGDIIL